MAKSHITFPFSGKTMEKLGVLGDEDTLHSIFDSMEMAIISGIPGIGIKSAVQLIQKYKSKQGYSLRNMLKTKDIVKVYRQLWKNIRSHFFTEFSREKLELFYPLSTKFIPEIEKRQKMCKEALELYQSLSEDQNIFFKRSLGKARPLKLTAKPYKIGSRIILCDSKQITENLKKRQLQRYYSIVTLGPTDKARDYIQGYDLVVFIHNSNTMYDSSLDYAENVMILEGDLAEWLAVPELILAMYIDNLDTVNASCQFADIITQLQGGDYLEKLRSQINGDVLKEVQEVIVKLQPDGKVVPGVSEDLDRFLDAVTNFDMILAEVEILTNEAITKTVQEKAVTIDGEQILRILQAASSGGGEATRLKSYLPPEIADVVIEALDKAETMICDRLHLTAKEAEWADGIIVRTVGLPVQVNKKKVQDLQTKLRQHLSMEEFNIKYDLAKKLYRTRHAVSQAVSIMLEFDFFLGLGKFFSTYDCDTPRISQSHHGVGFTQGTNIFLSSGIGIEKVTAVDYAIGGVPTQLENTHGERIVILSGANSGGKTCLLQTLLQILILGQTGFLVPAKTCEIGLFDEFYYYAKAEGMLSAGAFEASLKRLAEIIQNPTPKFACFDEWEAATEAEAAARIIATVLDIFAEKPESCVLFVSHLAEQISRQVASQVRIDGIEAQGLNEDLSLQVSRTPKFGYLARSMPELIVTRLYLSAPPQSKNIFEAMLHALRQEKKP